MWGGGDWLAWDLDVNVHVDFDTQYTHPHKTHKTHPPEGGSEARQRLRAAGDGKVPRSLEAVRRALIGRLQQLGGGRGRRGGLLVWVGVRVQSNGRRADVGMSE